MFHYAISLLLCEPNKDMKQDVLSKQLSPRYYLSHWLPGEGSICSITLPSPTLVSPFHHSAIFVCSNESPYFNQNHYMSDCVICTVITSKTHNSWYYAFIGFSFLLGGCFIPYKLINKVLSGYKIRVTLQKLFWICKKNKIILNRDQLSGQISLRKPL